MRHGVQDYEALDAGEKQGDTRFLVFKKTPVTLEPQEPKDKKGSVSVRCSMGSADEPMSNKGLYRAVRRKGETQNRCKVRENFYRERTQ